MPSGYAQFWTDVFTDAQGKPYSGVRIYVYYANTTSLAPVWLDAAKSAQATNPVVGDSHGRVKFYGDGDYRLRIEGPSSEDLGVWDFVRITQDTGASWEEDHGAVLPAASTGAKGQLFAQIDSDDELLSLQVHTGTKFQTAPLSVTKTTLAARPDAANAVGGLRLLTDSTRALTYSDGTSWYSLNPSQVNVMNFGAVADGETDDTDAVNAAMDELSTGGVCFFPAGIYRISRPIEVPSNVHVLGAGSQITRLVGNTGVSPETSSRGILVNSAPATGNSNITISNLYLQRPFESDADDTFNSAIQFNKCDQVRVYDCVIEGANENKGSKNTGVHLQQCTRIWIAHNYFKNWAYRCIYLDHPQGVTGPSTTDCAIYGNIFEIEHTVEHYVIQTTQAATSIHDNQVQCSMASGAAQYFVRAHIRGVLEGDLTISDNRVHSAHAIYCTAGSRISCTGNLCQNGSIIFHAKDSGNQLRDINISGNQVTGKAGVGGTGSISVRVEDPGALAQSVVIDGNNVQDQKHDANFDEVAWTQGGVCVQAATRVTVSNNNVESGDDYGFVISTHNANVSGNTALGFTDGDKGGGFRFSSALYATNFAESLSNIPTFNSDKTLVGTASGNFVGNCRNGFVFLDTRELTFTQNTAQNCSNEAYAFDLATVRTYFDSATDVLPFAHWNNVLPKHPTFYGLHCRAGSVAYNLDGSIGSAEIGGIASPAAGTEEAAYRAPIYFKGNDSNPNATEANTWLTPNFLMNDIIDFSY